MLPFQSKNWIESRFSRLAGGSPYQTTSPVDRRYNCIAFAAGDMNRWWEPSHPLVSYLYWPPGAVTDRTVAAYMSAFATVGYEPCDNAELEEGHEKVALFAKAGEPTHAARQLADGRWVSKLGQGFDIIHDDIAAVGGHGPSEYGDVAVVLRRQRL